ncbi:DNA polymerase III subunit delta [Chloroflexota bacterium]
MLYILLGEDDFSIRQSLEEIKGGLGDPTLLATNTAALEGQQLTLEQLRTVCETVPFLAEKRLVIVRGLLERFAPRGRPGRRKMAAAAGQHGGYEALAAYLHQIPESTVLVLIDGRVSSVHPLLKEISTGAVVRSFPLLREGKLRRWVEQHVAGEGGRISPQAVDLLAKIVGGNLWMMASEINKLVLFASGRRIEEEDVRLVVSHGQEANVFTMVDAILEFKARVAEQLLQQLLQRGVAPAYLMVVLSRQVQRIVRARELRGQGKSETEVQKKLGLTSEFALHRTLEQAARYPLERLKEVYHRLLETDLSIKTGRREGELALTILVAELCQRHGK